MSTRLDPGVDPIIEADRRGAILAILRLGNKDLLVPGDPNAGAMGVPWGMPGANGTAMSPFGYPPGAAGTACPTDGVTPVGYVAGVTVPPYGMPMSGTPIGLPGPPHVPLGVPAGLQRHSIRNHTSVHIPEPTRHVGIHVRQEPGFHYPKPANRVHIVEQQMPPHVWYHQPGNVRHQVIVPAGDPGCATYCPNSSGAQAAPSAVNAGASGANGAGAPAAGAGPESY